MADEKELKQAQAVFKALCQMLDEHEWHYEKDEEELSIFCGAQGEDLPMAITVEIDTERKIVTLLSKMPFEVPKSKRVALAVAVSKANTDIADGSFDYDFLSGAIIFRMTSSYRGSLIGKNLFTYMLMCSCHTIDDYNDKFLLLTKNEMSLEQILDFIS